MLDLAIAAFSARCDDAGLDVVHPFRLDWFNDDVAPSLRLPDGGRPTALGLVIGNTRRLWPAFAAALCDRPALRDVEHPLEAYVESALEGAASRSMTDKYVIFWAHRMAPAPIAIQRVADASGLAHLSPSRLSVHRTYGPWFALRAVVVVDAEGPLGERPCAPDPCTPCAKPCVAAFERALAATDANRPGDIERQWESWVNIRDVCPEGKAFRYSDDQVRYHYAKDRSILRGLIR